MLCGVEVMVGAVRDPVFGPLICFGLGGIHVELLGDVCWRMTPLTDRDADEMIRSIRGFPLLRGYRGQPPADVAAIRQVLLRAARLVEEIQEIRELDLNPVIVLATGNGCRIVDARMRVDSAAGGSRRDDRISRFTGGGPGPVIARPDPEIVR
jgi:acyl-CoA synthetase (NDP forming)